MLRVKVEEAARLGLGQSGFVAFAQVGKNHRTVRENGKRCVFADRVSATKAARAMLERASQ